MVFDESWSVSRPPTVTSAVQLENEQLRVEGQMLASVAEQQREREKARRGLPA